MKISSESYPSHTLHSPPALTKLIHPQPSALSHEQRSDNDSSHNYAVSSYGEESRLPSYMLPARNEKVNSFGQSNASSNKNSFGRFFST